MQLENAPTEAFKCHIVLDKGEMAMHDGSGSDDRQKYTHFSFIGLNEKKIEFFSFLEETFLI